MKRRRHAWQCPRLRNGFLTIAVLILCNAGSTSLVKADDCQPRADEVALFKNENYSGPCVMKGVGEHRVIQSAKSGPRQAQDVRRQNLSGFASIKVGVNVEALAYAESGLNGANIFIYQDAASFSGRGIATVSSLIVRRKDQAPQCRPNDNQIARWIRPYFFGFCSTYDIGHVEPNRQSILSLRIGANVEAQLCSESLFAGNCIVMLPGHYSHWTFPRTSDHSASFTVRRKGQSSCIPTVNQVSVYQYDHYAGPCIVFDIGNHSLNETLNWVARVPSWESMARSFRIGDNVQATFCWTTGTGARRRHLCAQPLSSNVPRGFRDLTPPEQVSLTVQRRGEVPPGGDRQAGNAPPAVSAHDFTVWLAGNSPFGAERGQPPQYPWWTGSYPTRGTLNGNLIRVANPRNSVWLGFIKSNYGSNDCGTPEAYVRLDPGETLTEDQMQTIFGSSSPALPVQFVACSGAVGQSTAGGGLTFPSLPLNITYTRRR